MAARATCAKLVAVNICRIFEHTGTSSSSSQKDGTGALLAVLSQPNKYAIRPYPRVGMEWIKIDLNGKKSF